MNDEANGYQRKKGRIDALSQEAERAAEEQDYKRAAELQQEILRLQDELIRQAVEPSNEQNYEKAALLGEEAERSSLEAQIEFEIARRNYVRAVKLMEQCQHPAAQVRNLQEQALKQYTCEYRNAQGLQKLIDWYGFSK